MKGPVEIDLEPLIQDAMSKVRIEVDRRVVANMTTAHLETIADEMRSRSWDVTPPIDAE